VRIWELREVVEEYELHSRRSTAVNEVLMRLRPAHSAVSQNSSVPQSALKAVSRALDIRISNRGSSSVNRIRPDTFCLSILGPR